jgi:uncharacterized protein YabN with tetrapyrrole methylase and pyrophosphatase domain
MTPETRRAIERADEVFHLVAGTVAADWIQRLRPDARSLEPHYREGLRRRDVYAAITDEILAAVRRGSEVCAVFYGHPGVFVNPSHEAVRRARLEGFPAQMLPAISAADCLFADLGVDPGRTGLQTYEATDFLIHRRRVDPSATLVLWQVSVVGDLTATGPTNMEGLAVLAEHLLTLYPAEHEVTLYEASPYPVSSAFIRTIPLAGLADVEPTSLATLYVPPAEKRRSDPAMLERLGLSPGR